MESAHERLLTFSKVPSIFTLNTILNNRQFKLSDAAPQEVERDGITCGAAYSRKVGTTK